MEMSLLLVPAADGAKAPAASPGVDRPAGPVASGASTGAEAGAAGFRGRLLARVPHAGRATGGSLDDAPRLSAGQPADPEALDEPDAGTAGAQVAGLAVMVHSAPGREVAAPLPAAIHLDGGVDPAPGSAPEAAAAVPALAGRAMVVPGWEDGTAGAAGTVLTVSRAEPAAAAGRVPAGDTVPSAAAAGPVTVDGSDPVSVAGAGDEAGRAPSRPLGSAAAHDAAAPTPAGGVVAPAGAATGGPGGDLDLEGPGFPWPAGVVRRAATPPAPEPGGAGTTAAAAPPEVAAGHGSGDPVQAAPEWSMLAGQGVPVAPDTSPAGDPGVAPAEGAVPGPGAQPDPEAPVADFPVRLLRRDPEGQVAVRVDAQELGPIEVAVQDQGGRLDLGLRAARPETADLLGQHLSELLAGLRSRRLEVGSATVAAGFHPQADRQAGHPSGRGEAQGRRVRRGPAVPAGVSLSIPALAPAAGWLAAARLDVMA